VRSSNCLRLAVWAVTAAARHPPLIRSPVRHRVMKESRGRCWLLAMGLLVLAGACGSDDGGPVVPLNHAPILRTQSDTTVAVRDTLHLWAVAHDQDGDPLIYDAVVVGTLADFKLRGFPDTDMESTDGHFEFRARAIDQPDRMFRFLVEDGRGGRDSTTFMVIVN
jgi:hypothetical protein